MTVHVWAVVKVPFPYTNRPVLQYRPALVVARIARDDAPALLWVLMITSAARRRWAGDVEITDLAFAGLPSASMIRTAKIATVEELDATPLGELTDEQRMLVGPIVADTLQMPG